MANKTLSRVSLIVSQGYQGITEIHQLPADGMTIGQASEIRRLTINVAKAYDKLGRYADNIHAEYRRNETGTFVGYHTCTGCGRELPIDVNDCTGDQKHSGGK